MASGGGGPSGDADTKVIPFGPTTIAIDDTIAELKAKKNVLEKAPMGDG
jgi:hypothetical protein